MPVLEADILESLKDTVAEITANVFPDLCDVQRGITITRDVNSPESFVETPNLAHIGLACIYRNSSGDERYVSDRVENVENYTVKLAGKYDIRTSDILKIRAKGSVPAFDLEVFSVRVKSNGVMVKIFAKRI